MPQTMAQSASLTQLDSIKATSRGPLIDVEAATVLGIVQRVHAELPLGVIVLAALDRPGRQAAHVVVAALDHATHSETGAAASCSGWQTTSINVGPA